LARAFRIDRDSFIKIDEFNVAKPISTGAVRDSRAARDGGLA
jgi:hypothetical protein